MRGLASFKHYVNVRQGAQRNGSLVNSAVPTPPRSLLSLSVAAGGAATAERALARRRYEAIIEEFRGRMRADRYGAQSSVSALLRPDSLIPPVPATFRGRFGHILVRWQSRLLWWTLRSFRLRDQAIESVWLSLESHMKEQSGREHDIRRQMLALDERVRQLELRDGT
ncbi:MAG: hypothetical protein C0504_02155 [Candidatus Solibacter sp.]|nr:hypothetical protein [Candidatus Solibacter sp.]